MVARPPADARGERSVYTVSRLNREVRLLLEHGMPVVWVEGEISNLAQPASGHWYFSLKDRDAQVRCAMFRQRNFAVTFKPQPGQLVIARGRVGLYEGRGEYQLVVEHLEPAGAGALQREFERLKAKLAAEGLFEEAAKRPLPRFPGRIGVVTSATGAALRDILHVLARRWPAAPVLVHPTLVQGATAAPAIVAALEAASARGECDVVILARGGGSLEDLWAFNDERVARAIRACSVPVVAGIGHEIDFTIADFAADVRAPTPSGAAELVVPDRESWRAVVSSLAYRLDVAARRELRTVAARFDAVRQRLKLAHPGMRLMQQTQRLDDLELRLAGAARALVQRRRSDFVDAYTRLVRQSPDRRVSEYRLRHEALEGRLDAALREAVGRAAHRLELAARTLHTVSPLATLGRGFAILTRTADGRLVTEAATVAPGERLRARLASGELAVSVLPDPHPGEP